VSYHSNTIYEFFGGRRLNHHPLSGWRGSWIGLGGMLQLATNERAEDKGKNEE